MDNDEDDDDGSNREDAKNEIEKTGERGGGDSPPKGAFNKFCIEINKNPTALTSFCKEIEANVVAKKWVLPLNIFCIEIMKSQHPSQISVNKWKLASARPVGRRRPRLRLARSVGRRSAAGRPDVKTPCE